MLILNLKTFLVSWEKLCEMRNVKEERTARKPVIRTDFESHKLVAPFHFTLFLGLLVGKC